MSFQFINGLPGYGTSATATPVTILRSLDRLSYAPGGFVLGGAYSSDDSNTANPDILTNGLALGKSTSGGNSGKYRPSIIGLIGTAYSNGGTSITVSAAVATEVARLLVLGAVALKAIGPPTAAGTVATTSVTVSAASGTTLTVSDLGVDKAAGTILAPADGAQLTNGLLLEEWALRVTDYTQTRVDQPLPRLLISGDILAANLPFYSAMDASVKTWFKGQLAANGRTFTFSDDY